MLNLKHVSCGKVFLVSMLRLMTSWLSDPESAEVSVFSIFNNSIHLKLISGDCLQLCGEADVSLQIVMLNFNVTECVT